MTVGENSVVGGGVSGRMKPKGNWVKGIGVTFLYKKGEKVVDRSTIKLGKGGGGGGQ